eukprot:SAG31_NODE_2691_length_5240_cov_1.866174_5_plen_47_part_00
MEKGSFDGSSSDGEMDGVVVESEFGTEDDVHDHKPEEYETLRKGRS